MITTRSIEFSMQLFAKKANLKAFTSGEARNVSWDMSNTLVALT